MDIDLDDIFSVPATKPAPATSKFRPNANRPVLRKGKCTPTNAKQGTSKSLEPAAAVNKAQCVAEPDAHVQGGGVSQSSNSSEIDRQESILESQRPPILSDIEKDSEIPIQDPETFPGFTVVQKSVTFEKDALLIGRSSNIDKETIETEAEAEVFPGLATIESFPDSNGTTCIGQHRGKFIPKKMKGGSKKPNSAAIQHSEPEKDNHPDILVDFEADLAKEGPTPSSGVQVSQLPDSETLEDCSEPSRFDTSISRESEVGDDPDVLGNSMGKRDGGVQDSLQKPVKSSSNGSAAANEVTKSSRPRRKRGEANGEEETLSQVKKRLRKSKTTKGEKPTKRSKNVVDEEEKLREEEQEEPPPKKKKFTHSTQRRKRVVDKVLLQTPEEDIDYQKLSMRDLILLAEHKEKLAKKIKMPKTSQEGSAASRQESVDGLNNNKESTVTTPEEDEGLDKEETDNVEPIITLFNYQSFMNKTPKIKWSKQDTELFYEGIRQFGTDLGMIKQLFPDLTRHQVKLKYKKEERQNPLRLSEAIHGGAKDHRHFELVIKQLEAANKADTESNAAADYDDDDGEDEEESNGEANKKNEEEAASIPNFDTKEQKKETKDEEIDHVNFETPQDQQQYDDDDNDNEDDIDEDFFSSYKTEL